MFLDNKAPPQRETPPPPNLQAWENQGLPVKRQKNGRKPMGFDGIRWVFGSALLLVHYCLGVQEANQTNLVAFVIVLYRLHVSCALASCISAAPNPELDVSGRKKPSQLGEKKKKTRSRC